MKDWVILTLNKASPEKMAKGENDLDIYYALGHANTKRQENEFAAIMKNVILQNGSWSEQVSQ